MRFSTQILTFVDECSSYALFPVFEVCSSLWRKYITLCDLISKSRLLSIDLFETKYGDVTVSLALMACSSVLSTSFKILVLLFCDAQRFLSVMKQWLLMSVAHFFYLSSKRVL